MNGTENRLRDALDGAARTVHQDDLHPLAAPRARSRVRRPLLIAATAVGLVAAAAGVVQLWPMSSRSAAAWSATPQAVDPHIARQLAEHCLSMRDDIVDTERTKTPRVIVDLRGNSAVVNIQDGAKVGNCTFTGIDLADPQVLRYEGGSAGWNDDTPPQPVGDSILTLESMSSQAVEGDALSEVSGQVGPNVDRVLVTLEDGSEVQARVQDGWYLAWWPEEVSRWRRWHWDSGGLSRSFSYARRMPTLIRAYDATGKLLKAHVPDGVPGR